MMEKLNPNGPPGSSPDLPCPSSTSPSTTSPSCAAVEQHSPPQNQTLASSEAIGSLPRANKAGHKGLTDVTAAGSIQSTITTTTELTHHRADTAGAPEATITEVKDEQEEKQGGRETTTTPPAASANRSPTLSSPPPLLPAPAKTSSPCPLPTPTSTPSFQSSSSSSPLPPHIPVISLGHSKPPLPLPNTPLTALHPIPNLLHRPHGDLCRSQLTCLPVASPGGPGAPGGPGVPTVPSSATLIPQQYLPVHSFTR